MRRILQLPAMLACITASVSALTIPSGVSHAFGIESRAAALALQLPASGLPSPSSISPAVQLRYIALGVGTQNYTCASTPNSASAPVAVGAIATLFDVGQFYSRFPQFIDSFPALALGLYSMTPDATQISKITGFAQLGNHFFNGAGQPTFDLTKVTARLMAKKLHNVPAPSDSCPGPNNAGAVDWLELTDVGGGASFGGLNYVYRVETAGGKPPATCTGQTGTFQVPYAAEYWFYGP